MSFSEESSPLLSIIIPTLNASGTLVRCLESIVGQTFKNYEILIIDSLSTDETLQIVGDYQSNYSKTKVISDAETGIYDGMNKGIDMAEGKWLYFMGSDDSLYDPTTLEQFVEYSRYKDVDVLYGNVFSTRFDGIYDGEFTFFKLERKNLCHQSIFFKKRVFKEIGKFDLKYKAHADWDHNIRWFFSSKISKSYIDLIVANYADGGYSSKNIDEAFQKDRALKIFFHGLTNFPVSHSVKRSRNIVKHQINKLLGRTIFKNSY